MKKESTSNKNNNWDVSRFESWLRVGVESYVLEGAGAEAFPGAIRYILGSLSLSQGLSSFAEDLNAKRQDAFKQAIANVLSSLEPEEKYIDVAEQLLAIAVATSAYPIIKALPGKIVRGFFGNVDNEAHRGLYAMTVYSVSRLATPGRDDTQPCLKALLQSKLFRPAYAGMILIALCQTDPENLADHMNTPNLRSMLHKQFDEFDDEEGTVKKRLADQVYDLIGHDGFKVALNELDILDSRFVESADDWLVEAIIDKIAAEKDVIKKESITIQTRVRKEKNSLSIERKANSIKIGVGAFVNYEKERHSNHDIEQLNPIPIGSDSKESLTQEFNSSLEMLFPAQKNNYYIQP